MKKKIILEFEKGLDPKYEKWTKEAAEKFIGFFPEFKDNFEISFEGQSFFSKAEVEDIISRSTQVSAQDVWNQFEKQIDGIFLRKNSVDWQINQASTNGKVDLRKWSTLKANGRDTIDIDEPIKISIAARKTTFAYGIGNILGPCLSAAACGDNEQYFKDIVMHELGHTFNATHENRGNIIENLGTHCTDADCLMYEYAYTQNSFEKRQQIGADNPFCDDCMISMQDFMKNNLKMNNNEKSIELKDLPIFKDITEDELISLDNYQRIITEKNIQRTDPEKLFDMMSIFISARTVHNTQPDQRGKVVNAEKFMEAVAKTDWNDAVQLKLLQDKIYISKRYATYKKPFNINDMENPTPEVAAIEAAQMAQGNLAKVSKEGYWVRKYGQGYFDNKRQNPKKDVHRFILNVNPSEDLFKKLDGFAEKYGCQYKFPHLLSWNLRIDPIIIYTSDDNTQQQIQELIKIASPSVRTEMMTNDLDGTKLADGIFMAKERDKADIVALAQKAQKNLPQLAQRLLKETNSSSAHPLSLGEFLSYEAIIDNANLAAQENFNIKMPAIDTANTGMREIYAVYNDLKKKNPALAAELEQVSNKYEQNSITDWNAVGKDPEYMRIRNEFFKNVPTAQNQSSPDNTNSENVQISNEKLEETNESGSNHFKKAYREIFEPAARKEGSQYVENISAKNYEAQIKKADGSIDYVEASSATNVSFSSKDKDGKVKAPEMERFENIVAYAKKKNARVAFGNIKTPEFKARLMIACLEAEPVAKMNGQTNLDKEFLDQIEPETKNRLLVAIKKTQPQKQQDDTGNNPPIPTPASQKNYEKSRETRIKFLEAKEKLGKITETEKAELDFAKEMVKVTTESAAAEARLGINPRDVEHQQNSGLAPKSYYYSTKTHHNCSAWKLHLDIVPNRNDPTTKAISEYLEALDVEHKIYHGGENGKGMTIYVGNYEDTKKLCKEINSRFGKDIEKSPCYVDQALSEHYFNDKVSGRFYLQGIFSTQYPRGSVAGICPSRYGSASDANAECFLFAILQKEGLIPAADSAGKYFNGFGAEDFHKHYEFHNIEAYCAHKLYQKEMGEFYCGSDADKYEKEMFGDKLPQAGAPERTKLDEIAKKYMTFMENQNPQLIQKMKNLATGYAPIDFSKAPKIVPPQPTKQGGRS